MILASDEVAVTLRALATRLPAQQPAGDVPRRPHLASRGRAAVPITLAGA